MKEVETEIYEKYILSFMTLNLSTGIIIHEKNIKKIIRTIWDLCLDFKK